MEIEFDADKDAENIRQRDISLAFGAVIIKTAFGQVEDMRRDYGEVRMKAFAECNGLCFLLHVYRARHGDAHRQRTSR